MMNDLVPELLQPAGYIYSCDRFDYSRLDAQIRTLAQTRADEIKRLMKQTAYNIIQIGQKLLEMKECLGHGYFGRWLRAEFEWSQDTANRFINVAKHLGEIPQIAEFDIAPSALYLLAAPSTPDAARDIALERAARGESITHKAAKAIVAEVKKTTGSRKGGSATLTRKNNDFAGGNVGNAAGDTVESPDDSHGSADYSKEFDDTATKPEELGAASTPVVLLEHRSPRTDNPQAESQMNPTSSSYWDLDSLQRRFLVINLYDQQVAMKIERLASEHGKLPQTIVIWGIEAFEVLPEREKKITKLECELQSLQKQIAELEQALAQKNDTQAELEKKLADAAQTIAALQSQQSTSSQPYVSDSSVPSTAQSSPNFKPLIEFFDKAAKKVEKPTAQIHLDGNTIVVSRNSNGYSGKHTGVLNLNTVDGILQARINEDGSLLKSEAWQDWALPMLEEFAQSPGAIASIHGKVTGHCCFCGGALTDPTSLSTGYGKDCAEHYGLPWNHSELEATNEPGDENNAHANPASSLNQNVTSHSSANISTIQQGCSAVSITTGESVIVTGLFEQNGIQMAKIKYTSDGLEAISRVDYLSPHPH